MKKYELINLKASKPDGKIDLYQLRDLENPEQPLEWFSFIKVKEMLISGVPIKHVSFTHKGIVIDATINEEIEKLFNYLIKTASVGLSRFIEGEAYDIHYSKMNSAFKLRTNVVYRDLRVTLQFELGVISEPVNLFDKPLVKVRVKYLLGEKRLLSEIFFCKIIKIEEENLIGHPAWLSDIYSLISWVNHGLSQLNYVNVNSVLPNLFSMAFYKFDAYVYTENVARLLCARLIDKYNIFAYNPYQLFELYDGNIKIGAIAAHMAFSIESELQDRWHTKLVKNGDRFFAGFGLKVPLTLSSENNNVHSITIRLIATENGISIQLINVMAESCIDLLTCTSRGDAVYSHTLIKSFFIPIRSMGKKSVLSVIDNVITYIEKELI